MEKSERIEIWYGEFEINAAAEQKSKILQKKKGGICQIRIFTFIYS